ncbi:MAG: glycosyl hydrolase [Acidobacteriota bacterium]
MTLANGRSAGRKGFALLAISLLAVTGAWAQGSAWDYEPDEKNQIIPPEALVGFDFQSLGFSRGGRSTAVSGVLGDPLTYYFGGTGGGVWKTSDAGNNWTNITDGYMGVGAIGSIAVADSDPNVIYVGTGSTAPRGNISNGDGIYVSTDAGKTWRHSGLKDGGQIGKIRVHPTNPDVAWAAVLGNIFGPNEERGIYRTQDGGKTWEKILYLNERTGFVDISIDATNPRILYAAAWRAERKPWTLISGGEVGGMWKTTDGGDNWTKLEKGLPDGLIGKIGVVVSPANPNRVWAMIEADQSKGGVYRSDDAGESWRRLTSDAKLFQRPWYYNHIYADPQNENVVYVLNTGFYRSIDGGRSFSQSIRVPHGDNHDLWINPANPENMINSNDGGANVSFDGGKSWSWQMNQPTAEMYRVFVDNQWPYRIYGPQQDNSTISIPSRGFVAWNRQPPDWYSVGGCESGHIAVNPDNPDVVFAGCYGGSISRTDLDSGDQREVIAYPQLQLGQAPRDLKYRFQWNAPIRISPHDSNVVYHTSQVVHRSTDEGQSWEVISPDLTTNNKEQQDFAGGPISHDSTGVEVYNTVFAFEESKHRKGELWAGTDDGRIHVSRDNGANWEEVTPKKMPEGGTVNAIEISAHDPDRIFTAVYRYRENDFNPYVFRTTNGGKSWDLLTDGTNGIPETNFTRAIREDPVRQGLLYAGTEFGLYLSFDDGEHWQRFGDDQKLGDDLPVTPVTDIQVHRGDLVLSTQGRSFWILRDLGPLRQLTPELLDEEMGLMAPSLAYRGGGSANIPFYVKALPEENKIALEIKKGDEVVHSVEWKPGDKAPEADPNDFRRFFGFGGGDKLVVEEGLNTFSWNLREKAPEKPKGVVHWGFTPGVTVPPGEYTVSLTSGDWSQSQPLKIEKWPTAQGTQADFEEQYELGNKIAGHLNSIFDAITEIRTVKGQIKTVQGQIKESGVEAEEVMELAKEVSKELTEVEEQLTQTKSKSNQDPLNFPPMIDNQFVELYAYVVASQHKPPAGAYERLDDLAPELDGLLTKLGEIQSGKVTELNERVAGLALPAIGTAPTDDD